VITRRDTDGLYYPGRVLKQLLPTRHYLIQWTNGSTQEQEVVHMFGPLTRRHPMRVGDHVLALADKSNRHLLRYNMPLTKLLKNIHPFRYNYSYRHVHTSRTVTSTQAEIDNK